jgi:hypothetical protein
MGVIHINSLSLWNDFIGLTHEQLIQLRTILKEDGFGKQGHSRTMEENALALLQVNYIQELGHSLNVSLNATASAHLASPTTLRSVLVDFQSTGTITPADTSHRGRGNPHHPLHHDNILLATDQPLYGPTLEAEILIHELIRGQRTRGTSVTSTTVAAELNEQFKIDVCIRTVRRWLGALGYRYRHKRYVGGMKPQAKNIRIRQYIIEYAAALGDESTGTAVIVYMDESYIHPHIASKYGWFHQSDRDVLGDDNGKRLIILHAMTENGLLAMPDEVASNWLNEPARTAELVFEEVLEDGQDDSDYHNTITGAKFVAWLRNRLLPTFNELYPNKKMYLVLDNAAYHKARDETWISTASSQSKHELAHTLIDLGVAQLTTISDNPTIIQSHKFLSPITEGGPTKEDLIAAIQLWLDEHPDHNKTVVEQLMNDAGHSLIYTPPFCPEVQPIELLWAHVKRQVANRSTLNRSIIETRQQTETAFESITPLFCNNIISHCHNWIDTFIQSDQSQDLHQCHSLAGVIKHLSLLKLSTEVQPIYQAATMNTYPPCTTHPAPSNRILRKRH